jgi:hypothetical protein
MKRILDADKTIRHDTQSKRRRECKKVINAFAHESAYTNRHQVKPKTETLPAHTSSVSAQVNVQLGFKRKAYCAEQKS